MRHKAGLKELLEKIEEGGVYYLLSILLSTFPYETRYREVLDAEGAREAIRRFVAGSNYAERTEGFDIVVYDPPEPWRRVLEDWLRDRLDGDVLEEGVLIGEVRYEDAAEADFWEVLEIIRLE